MDDNNISGAWDWSQGPPTVMANPNPDAVPLVDPNKINLGNYDLSGLTVEEQAELTDSLLHGNTDEDLATLQPYLKQQNTAPYAQKTEVNINLDKYDLDAMSPEEKQAVLLEIENGNQAGAEMLLAGYEKPSEFAQYASETPLSLKYSNYAGNQLSIKPTSVEYVINYFTNTIVTDLESQYNEVLKVHTELEAYAAEDPAVEYGLNIGSVFEACVTAVEESALAATTIANVAAAIKEYGENGWNLDACSILNNFLGGSEPGDNNQYVYNPNTNSTGVGTTNPDKSVSQGDSAVDSGNVDDLVNVGDNDSVIDNIFDLGDDALDNTGGDVVVSYTGGTGGIFDEVRSNIKDGDASTAAKFASLIGIEDLNGDGIIEDDEISEAFSSFGASGFFVPSVSSGDVAGVKTAGIAGAVGITAAAAVAVGGKVYYDKKKEDEEEDDKSEESDDIITGAEQKNDTLSGLNMVEFKEELLHIGEDDE